MSEKRGLNIIVLGASGDLARKKIFPALFSLHCRGLLPRGTKIFGFSRSAYSHDEFREHVTADLTCRYTPGESCAEKMNEFLSSCFYAKGDYGNVDDYLELHTSMEKCGDANRSNRLFYFAIPPSIFTPVAKAIGDSGMVFCEENENTPWSRVVVEKPFGRDRESSDVLTGKLREVFLENQIYRIDHYLGKEMVQNIQVVRFANQILKPIWNGSHIASVHIDWAENIGTDGRGGYFDNYGIIRDVIQNHLLQILALVAMDEPPSLSAEDVRAKKVELLKAIPPLSSEDVVIGQYTAREIDGVARSGYRDDPTVPDDSITPTFAKIAFRIENERWEGVDFTIRAGKGMPRKMSEIRITFKSPESNVFCKANHCPPPNELIIRIQPDEGMHLNIVNKIPGKSMGLNVKKLDLSYSSAYEGHVIPDAYESLLLDVVNGEKSLFIRDDELRAAWDIFTPLLHHLEENHIEPIPYPFGTDGV